MAQFTNYKLRTSHQKMTQNELQLVVCATQIRINAIISLAHTNKPQRIKRKPFLWKSLFTQNATKGCLRILNEYEPQNQKKPTLKFSMEGVRHKS